MKYFLLGAFSSAFFLYGIALRLRLRRLVRARRRSTRRCRLESGANGLLLAGIGLIAVGLLFKVGAAPFHAWTPDVYQGAPTAVTAFMAACTKVAAFGALLRVFYVALRRRRWDWRPMMWVVADAHDGGRLDHRDHPDRREADAGLLVDRPRRLPDRRLRRRRTRASAIADSEITSLQAVLFYLVAYGFTTIGAFAVVTLVRDAGGETTHLSRWAGLGKEAPVLAGVFAFFLLAFAGIPLTSGFTGKWAVFTVRVVRRRLAAGRGRGADEPGGRVLLRPGHRRDVLLRPGRRRPDGRRPEHPDHRRDHHRCDDDAASSASCRSRSSTWPARPGSSSADGLSRWHTGQCRANEPRCSHCPDRAMVDPAARRRGSGRSCSRSRRSWRWRSRPTSTSSPRRRGTCSTPAASGSGRCWCVLAAEFGDPDATGVVPAALVVELTHLATLYHDDVMDEADLRRGAQSANARWDNSVAILTGDFLFAQASDIVADLGPDGRADPGADLLAAGPGADPRDHRAARRRGPAARTTCRSSPTRPAR